MKHVFARCLLMLFVLSLGVCGAVLAEGYVWVIPPQFDDARNFSEGLAAVVIGDKWGYIDKAGEIVVPPKYDSVHGSDWFWNEDAGAFRDGMAGVMVGEWRTGKIGFVDKTGKEVVPCTYDDVGSFSEGLAAIRVGDWPSEKWGFIDTTGKEVIPPQYDWVGEFNDGLAMVWIGDQENDGLREAGKWGFIDTVGKEVVPVEYDRAGEFREGLAGVIKEGLLGFVDKTGAIVIPPTYAFQSELLLYMAWYDVDSIPYFSEGLAAIWGGDAQNGQYCYIDRAGNVIIPFAYGYAAPFSEGLAYVSKGGAAVDPGLAENGVFGFIDKTGEVAVPLAYDCDYWEEHGFFICEQFFVDGFTLVSKGITHKDMKYGMIDKTGAIIVPIEYDWIWLHGWHWNFDDGLALVGFGNDTRGSWYWDSCGLVDKTGREIVAVGHYDEIEQFNEGFARVLHGARRGEFSELKHGTGTYGFIDTTGKEVVPCVFDDARPFSEGLAAVKVDGKWGYISIQKGFQSDVESDILSE